jgi:hypothetical protein
MNTPGAGRLTPYLALFHFKALTSAAWIPPDKLAQPPAETPPSLREVQTSKKPSAQALPRNATPDPPVEIL